MGMSGKRPDVPGRQDNNHLYAEHLDECSMPAYLDRRPTELDNHSNQLSERLPLNMRLSKILAHLGRRPVKKISQYFTV